MTIAEVKEILCGSFASESDRQYWVNKIAEMEAKETNSKESEKYYSAMAKYAR